MSANLQPITSDGGFTTTGNVTSGNIITSGSGGDITLTGGNIAGVRNISLTGNVNGAGNLDIDGSATVGGNLFVTGNINFSGNVTQISGNSGVFYGNTSTGVGALYAGKTGYTPLPSTIVQMTGDENAYIQTNLQNTNHGNTASMELAITADDGTDTTNYIDLGIASSAWDGTQDNSLGDAVEARDGYLYVQGGSTGGNLVLGTTTAGYAVKFNAGGPGSTNTVATISSTGITATGNITGSYFLGNGSQLTGITVSGSNPVTTTGNVSAGNLITTGTVSANNIGNIASLNLNGNASTVLYGNGTFAAVAAGSSYGDSNVATFLASYGSNTISTTGNVTGGNIRPTANIAFTANSGQINFNTTAYITGNAVGREGSISLQPYTGAGSTFPGVLIGGAGRILAPNGSAHLVLNTSDFTVQVAQKIIAGTVSTSTTTGALQVSGGAGVTGNVYAGNVYSTGLLSVTGNANVGNLGTAGQVTATGNVTGGNITTAGQVTATGNITTSGNFVGNGAALSNVTVSVAGNIIGTQSNVTLVAGSYNWTFDNGGTLTIPATSIGSGNEGGEIDFTKAPGSTLSGNVVAVDQYADKIRFFEGGGTARGAYIDLSQAAAGVGTLLNNRVSGIVNAGTFVTMDLLKATLTSSGQRGLSLAATTGSFSIQIGGNYSLTSATTGGSAGTGTINTTPSASQFNWNFLGQGDTSTYIITDTTNSRSYRVILQIGPSFNNNLITIERLV